MCIRDSFGVLGPAGMPNDIVIKLNNAMVQALQSADLKDRMATFGVEPISSTPDQYARYIKAEIAKWTKVVKAAGVKAE